MRQRVGLLVQKSTSQVALQIQKARLKRGNRGAYFGGALKFAKRAQWLSLFFEDQHRVQGGFIEFIDLFDFEMAGFDKRLEFEIGAPTEPARHRVESLRSASREPARRW